MSGVADSGQVSGQGNIDVNDLSGPLPKRSTCTLLHHRATRPGRHRRQSSAGIFGRLSGSGPKARCREQAEAEVAAFKRFASVMSATAPEPTVLRQKVVATNQSPDTKTA